MPAATGTGQTNTIAGEPYVSFQEGTQWVWRKQATISQTLPAYSRKERVTLLSNVTGTYVLDLDTGTSDNFRLDCSGDATITLASSRPGLYVIAVKKNAHTVAFATGTFMQLGEPSPTPDGWTVYIFAKIA